MKLSGGDKVVIKLAEIAREAKSGSYVRVGFLEGSTYSDGTPVALVAAVQDFGSPRNNIPSRPFFRNMIRDKSAEWPVTLGKLMKNANYNARTALGQMGAIMVGQLRDSITDGTYVPLAPATVARKGFAQILVETGHLVSSADSEVVE